MSKVRDISNLSNVIRTDASGNVSFVSGSTTLATLNTSGQLSGSSPVLSSSYALNADLLDGLDSTQFTLTSSFAAQTASFTAFTASVNSFTASQLVLNGKYATTGSNTFTGIQTINSNLVVTGSITAQTLVVQTITSSIVYSSGSNVFGNNISNTQVFTGSVNITGSINLSGSAQSTNYISQASSTISGLGPYDWSIMGRGTNGSAILINDIAGANYAISSGGYNLTFSKHVSGSNVFTSSLSINGGTATNSSPSVTVYNNLGIGTTSPTSRLHIINNTDGFVGRFTGGAASTVTAGIYANSTTGFASIGVQSAHQFRIFTSDTDRLTITSDGNIGINTISPTAKLHIVGITGLPATSGTSQNGTLRLQLSGYGTVLDFGGEGPSTGKQWIQATDASSLAYTYPLLLNPNGGVVIVGTSISSGYGVFNTYKLPVSNNYVDQIIVQGTGNYPSLRLGTYDSYDGVVATTGNDLRILSGLNVTTEDHNIMFYTSFNGGTTGAQNYERMRIAYNGNVGIGSATPGAKLDIVASAPYVFRVTNNGSASGNNPTAQFYNQYGDHSWGICAEFRTGGSGGGTDRSSILFSNGYDTNTWGCGFGFNDSSYFRINKDQGPYGGGWGTTLLSIDRSGNYSFAGSNVSDRRNKKDITYIEDSQLSIILKLKPASFNKKSPGKDEYSDHVHTGFIAQDVLAENIPNLVHGNEEEGYGLDYDGILALAVKAIQEQQAQINELKAQING
jgi:hypothetical protein